MYDHLTNGSTINLNDLRLKSEKNMNWGCIKMVMNDTEALTIILEMINPYREEKILLLVKVLVLLNTWLISIKNQQVWKKSFWKNRY